MPAPINYANHLQFSQLTLYSAASAIAANTFLRSIAAAGFPLFARQMFNGMGIQYAGTLLGCLAAAMVPIPVMFYIYGKKLRAKSKFAPKMKAPKPPVDESEESSDNDEPQNVALMASRSHAPEPPNGVSRVATQATHSNSEKLDV